MAKYVAPAVGSEDLLPEDTGGDVPVVVDLAGVPIDRVPKEMERARQSHKGRGVVFRNVPEENEGVQFAFPGFNTGREVLVAIGCREPDRHELAGLLGRYLHARLTGTAGAVIQSEGEHFRTPDGNAHFARWYVVEPLLDQRGMLSLLAVHLARGLEEFTPDVFLSWAGTGRALAAAAVSRLFRTQSGVVDGLVLAPNVSNDAPALDRPTGESLHGRRVAVIVDVLCTGAKVGQLVHLVQKYGGTVVVVGCVVRYRRSRPLDSTLDALGNPKTVDLVQVDDEVFEPTSCPWCKKGEPAIPIWSSEANKRRPGRGEAAGAKGPIDARFQWLDFWKGNVSTIDVLDADVYCPHCHDGQVLDLAGGTREFWNDLVDWAYHVAVDAFGQPDQESSRYIIHSRAAVARRLAEAVAARINAQPEHAQFAVTVMGTQFDARQQETTRPNGQPGPPQGARCIVVDDAVFTTRTAEGMVDFVERHDGRVVSVLVPLYSARGSAHSQFSSRFRERLAAGYVAALHWSDLDRCPTHDRANRLMQMARSSARLPQHLSALFETASSSRLERNRHARDRGVSSYAAAALLSDDSANLLDDFLDLATDFRVPEEHDGQLSPAFAIPAQDLAERLSIESLIQFLTRASSRDALKDYELRAIADLVDSIPETALRDEQVGAALIQLLKVRGSRLRVSPVDWAFIAAFRGLWEAKHRWSDVGAALAALTKRPLWESYRGQIEFAIARDWTTPTEVDDFIRPFVGAVDRGIVPTSHSAALREDLLAVRRALADIEHSEPSRHVVLRLDSANETPRRVDPQERVADGEFLVDWTSRMVTYSGTAYAAKARRNISTTLVAATLLCIRRELAPHDAAAALMNLGSYGDVDDAGITVFRLALETTRKALRRLRERFPNVIDHRKIGRDIKYSLRAEKWALQYIDGDVPGRMISAKDSFNNEQHGLGSLLRTRGG